MEIEDIIVFGRGSYYKSKETELKRIYSVIAFIDNSVTKEEELSDNGIPIYNPMKIDNLPTVPIFIMSVHFFQMTEQLISLGVDETRIRFGNVIAPYYDNGEKAFQDLGYDFIVKGKKITLTGQGKEYTFQAEKDYKETLRKIIRERDPYIKWITGMPLKPLSERFGLEYGKAIDRYYIEKFLSENKRYITGDVMEMAENTYTNMYGENIKHAYAMHVNGWGENCIKGNLETGEGISENSIDCFICTQTIQFIYDIHSMVKNIYKMLKPGGTALVTAHCLGQISLYDYHNWGEYWRFTDMSMRRLFAESFDEDKVTVKLWGNVKTAIAFQYGLCAENLQETDFAFHDEQYPVIVTAFVRK